METVPERYRRRVENIGRVLLLVFYFVVPALIQFWGGSAGLDIGFLFIFGSIGLALCIGVCLLWWRIVRENAKWIAPNKAVWTGLVLLPVILIGGYAAHCSWPSVRAERILFNADLAALPPSAREIKVYLWFTPFSGEGYLRFSADTDDVERFLVTSPILRDVEYTNYSEDGVALFHPRDERHPASLEDIREHISREPSTAPVWFARELIGSMAWYRIDPSGSQVSGALIVDHDRHTIYVRLSFD